jgi:uncharacterized membrane protein YhdT
MGAKRYDDWANLALWLALAGMAVWLVAGGMPAGIERGLVGFPWVLAGFAGALLLLCGAGGGGMAAPAARTGPAA